MYKNYICNLKKLLKKINIYFLFIINFILKNVISFFVCLFVIRNKRIILIGNYPYPVFNTNNRKEQFLHNTKYLFLKLSNSCDDFKFIYLCDDKNMRKSLLEKGYKNIYSRNSLKGIYYSLRAKYWITNYNIHSVANPILSYGAKVINCFHGAGIKKIMYNDEFKYPVKKYPKLIYNIWNKLRIKYDYFIVNSDYEAKFFESAYITNENQQIILGSPRLDVLYNNIKNEELFLEEDYNNIKNLKDQSFKLLVYMPTWRDTGNDISSWLNSKDIHKFLKKNNTIIICKLHPSDKNSSTTLKNRYLYFMNKNSDIYPILKFTDGLITDYSTIGLDYLLLDKPIIYYTFDLKEYQEQCRGFYRPFEEFVAGDKIYTEEELLTSMQKIINGEDRYKEQRSILRNKMYKYQDGKNCERFIDWLRNID